MLTCPRNPSALGMDTNAHNRRSWEAEAGELWISVNSHIAKPCLRKHKKNISETQKQRLNRHLSLDIELIHI